MRICGVDFSTKAVDLVFLPFEQEPGEVPSWVRVELNAEQDEQKGSFHAALRLRERLSGRIEWEDVPLVYLERPYSRGFQTTAALMRVQGAIIASLPKSVRLNGQVNEISPQEWKRVFCGHPAASKDEVTIRANELGFDPVMAPQDAFDAYGICWAARAENWAAIAS